MRCSVAEIQGGNGAVSRFLNGKVPSFVQFYESELNLELIILRGINCTITMQDVTIKKSNTRTSVVVSY